MLNRIRLYILIASIVAIVVGMVLLQSDSYSGMFDSRAAAQSICNSHKGYLGQAAGSACGVMDGSGKCRKGKVNAMRTECVAPANFTAYGVLLVGGVGLLTSIVFYSMDKRKSATKARHAK